MACPYAKNLKGTIAYCELIRKKVSTLRFPCKGNYRRCPIYARYTARKREVPAPQPRVEAPVEKTVAAEAEPVKRGIRIKPSEVLCDSLILAALLTSGSASETFRATLSELVKWLETEKGESESLNFLVGTIDSYSFRGLYRKLTLTYMFEQSGRPYCGEEASKLFEKLKDSTLDIIIYTIDWESIPLWKETIIKELE